MKKLLGAISLGPKRRRFVLMRLDAGLRLSLLPVDDQNTADMPFHRAPVNVEIDSATALRLADDLRRYALRQRLTPDPDDLTATYRASTAAAPHELTPRQLAQREAARQAAQARRDHERPEREARDVILQVRGGHRRITPEQLEELRVAIKTLDGSTVHWAQGIANIGRETLRHYERWCEKNEQWRVKSEAGPREEVTA